MQIPDGVMTAILVSTVAVTAGGYLLGRRLNRAVALRVAREMEDALSPMDTTYTWIGGLIGYHATFSVSGFERFEATCTLLPRHAPLYLPLALVLGRHDRVHLTFHMGRPLITEAHVISRAALRSPLLRIEGSEKMLREQSISGGRTFVLMAKSALGLSHARELVGRFGAMGLVSSLRHAAIVPGGPTVYAQVVPRKDVVRKTAGLLREWAMSRAS